MTYGSVALNGRTEAISSSLDLRLSARLRRKSVCFDSNEGLRPPSSEDTSALMLAWNDEGGKVAEVGLGVGLGVGVELDEPQPLPRSRDEV